MFCVLSGLNIIQSQDTPGAETALWNSALVVQQQGAWWGLLRYQHLFLSTLLLPFPLVFPAREPEASRREGLLLGGVLCMLGTVLDQLLAWQDRWHSAQSASPSITPVLFLRTLGQGRLLLLVKTAKQPCHWWKQCLTMHRSGNLILSLNHSANVLRSGFLS